MYTEALAEDCKFIPMQRWGREDEMAALAIMLASTAGGDVQFSGLLTRLLWMKGSAADAAASMPAGSALIDPEVGHRYQLCITTDASAEALGTTP